MKERKGIPYMNKRKDSSIAGKLSLFCIVAVSILTVWLFVFGIISSIHPILKWISTYAEIIKNWLGISNVMLVSAVAASMMLSISVFASISKPFKLFLISVLELLKFIMSIFLPSVSSLVIEKSFYKKPLTSGEMPLPSDKTASEAFSVLLSRISNLEDQRREGFNISGEKTQEIKDDVLLRIKERLTIETLESISQESHNKSVASLEENSLARLSNLSVALGARANLTLRMGVLFCMSGIFVIAAIFLFIAPIPSVGFKATSWIEILITYVPRFTMVIFIELIGIFFLKLYKATLDEIRFIHNEITNVEMRLIALHSSHSSSEAVRANAIGSLVATERNSIINKDQTTIEIERSKAVTEADRSVMNAAVSLLHGTEKGSFWNRGKT